MPKIKDTEIRVCGYMCLNYGKEFLKESLMSIVDYVDVFYIMYSPVGSYGHHANIPCPDTREELYEIAESVLGDKMVWHERTYHNEGEHRNEIYKFSDGYDLVVTIDSDEIFSDEIGNALIMAYKSKDRFHGLGGYLNFFRSFQYVCHDGFTPIRITNLHNESGQGVVPCTVYHFSCCQSEEIMRYKLLIHGHKDEIRPNWLEDIYLKWTPENNFPDLHVVAYSIWNATFFDKSTLPECLKNHKYYNLHIV